MTTVLAAVLLVFLLTRIPHVLTWAAKPARLTHAQADRIALHLGEDYSALDVLDLEAHGTLVEHLLDTECDWLPADTKP